MSDAFAQIFTPGGDLLGYSIYQGSADLVRPAIEPEFTWDPEWRQCNDEGQPCIVWEDYGGGCWFESRYCAQHRCLTGELSQWGDPITGDGGLPADVREERVDRHPFPEKDGTDLRGSLGATSEQEGR